jgi:hypothetical protein
MTNYLCVKRWWWGLVHYQVMMVNYSRNKNGFQWCCDGMWCAMATFVPNVTMDNKHKIFAIVKSNDRSWPSIVGLASLYFQSSNFNNFFFFNSPKFTRAFCRQTFLISQNGVVNFHHMRKHCMALVYFYTFMNGSSSTNTIITHGMVVASHMGWLPKSCIWFLQKWYARFWLSDLNHKP